VRAWTVGGAVIEASSLAAGPPAVGVLLVENLRRSGGSDWTPPGGVIDRGESVVAGLAREVAEETGLVVLRWDGPIYGIEVEAPGLGWTLQVEVHRAVEISGELRVGADPDGIVVDAVWADRERCTALLDGSQPWVREPLLDWLAHPWAGSRRYRYRVAGVRPDELEVERLSLG
jgi:8-oxo-dGTP diphosphatase